MAFRLLTCRQVFLFHHVSDAYEHSKQIREIRQRYNNNSMMYEINFICLRNQQIVHRIVFCFTCSLAALFLVLIRCGLASGLSVTGLKRYSPLAPAAGAVKGGSSPVFFK